MMKRPRLKDNEQQALQELKERLRAIYGSRLKQTLLYGSKARGDATEESDIDVMAVITDLPHPRQDSRQLTPIISDIDLSHNVWLSVFTVDADYFEKAACVPFYANVKSEGISL